MKMEERKGRKNGKRGKEKGWEKEGGGKKGEGIRERDWEERRGVRGDKGNC